MISRRAPGVGLLSVMFAGCQKPPGIVPIGPPGVDLDALRATKEESKAEALGEGGEQASATPALVSDQPPTPIGEPKTTESGLIYETLVEGKGDTATAGARVSVKYVGKFSDGKVFDSSADHGGRPYIFELGILEADNAPIRGWHIGVAGMKEGETRRLTIPPKLAYGDEGRPPSVPPKATLIFDVELVESHVH